ncbi:F-box family protein [Striga asiatica]|uniref:F-box family protein n=1 Tax=Striga asiatica TaxID=4170 RepID=A0A5A7PXB7_STRAF|nr:F-box family protein [Striga asiatica]
MPEMMEMESNAKLRCCTSSDVSKRRIILKSADSPHGAVHNTEVTISFQDGQWPEWVLMEVLCRLPIKMVIQCKSVSKQWLSLISDPYFSRFYNITSRGWQASAFSGSVWRRPPLVFIYKRMSAEACEMTFFSDEGLMDIMYPFPNSPSPNYCVLPLPKSQQGEKGRLYTIQAIHEGLVLYKWSDFSEGVDELYICNPMTNQWFPLPRPKYIPKTNASYGFITRVKAGILTSYRVVLVRCHRQKQSFVEFEVFCSESGKWVEYTVHSTRAVRVSIVKKTVFLDGKLHWDDCELGLIAYDPYTSPDEMRLIEFPKDMYRSYRSVSYNLNFSSCGVHQGLLKYFVVTDPFSDRGFSHLKIWVLEDYEMGRWCLQHMVACEDINSVGRRLYRRPVELICFHPYDADIVYMQCCKDLVSYDMRTRELRQLRLPQEPKKNLNLSWDPRCLYIPLLLPAWPICIPTSLIPKL